MGLMKWLLGDTGAVVNGQYIGDRVPSSRQPDQCSPPEPGDG